MKTFAKFEIHPVVKEVDGKFIGTLLIFQNAVLIEFKTTQIFDTKRDAVIEVQMFQTREMIKAQLENERDMH